MHTFCPRGRRYLYFYAHIPEDNSGQKHSVSQLVKHGDITDPTENFLAKMSTHPCGIIFVFDKAPHWIILLPSATLKNMTKFIHFSCIAFKVTINRTPRSQM